MAQDLYDQLAEEEAGQRAAAAQAAVRGAAGVNPDQQAKVLQLSRVTGIPAAVVGRNQDAIETQARARETADMLARSPILARQMADSTFTTVAQDDVPALTSIEKAIGGIASYVMGAREGGGLPGLAGRAARSLAAGVPTAGASMYGAAAFPAEALGLDGIGGFLRNEQRAAAGVAARVAGPAGPNAGIFERGVMSGMQSAGQNLVTLPLGFANTARVTGEQMMLGAMGALTFGQSYGKARDAGAGVFKSGAYAAEDATAEVVTEKFAGAAGLLGDAKAGMGAARLFIRDLVREIPGEMGATLWQNFNEWANLNPDKPVSQFLDEQPAALLETAIATVVGGGAQVGAIRVAQKVMGDGAKQQAQARQAEQFAAQAEALNKLGAASKLAGRDAETFRQYVAQVADEQGDAPTEFYIDGETLANSLNQSGISRQELEAIAPVVAQQMDAAMAGAMVRVPVSEFMAAGEKITAPLIDHLRSDPEAMSRTEAADYVKTEGAALQSAVEAELQKHDDAATHREGIAAVQSQFEGELNKAGRFTAPVNKAYAGMLANFYGATAARLGMTPQELLGKYQLRVQSKVGEGGQTLNQGDTTTPEFRNWFGDSKVVDASGKPRVVYHGTNDTFTKVNFKKGAQGLFWFTSDKSSIQSGEAGAQGASKIMPLFAQIKNPAGWAEYDKFSVDELRARGFDGVILPSGNGEFDGFIFKSATQVKHAERNRGTYDPADPSILNQSAVPEAAAKPTPEVIELRKRASVLESLLECMNG
jgi:hypothetical protein